jgi:heme exporter protein D
MKIKEMFSISWAPVVVASLCCLSPIIVVLAGVGTVSFATSLADTLYGDYKWLFRIAGLIALAIAVVLYLRRKKGICTLDDAKRRKGEIINIAVIALTAGILGYIVFLYVILHYAGVFLNIWT